MHEFLEHAKCTGSPPQGCTRSFVSIIIDWVHSLRVYNIIIFDGDGGQGSIFLDEPFVIYLKEISEQILSSIHLSVLRSVTS